MKKSFLTIFICLSLMFLFDIPTMAEETSEPIIKINGIYQDDELVQLDEEGNYVVDKYDEVILDFELENIKENDYYYVSLKEEDGGGVGFLYNDLNGHEERLSFYNNNNYKTDGINTYTIKVCDEWECNKLYTEKTINVKLTYYEEIKDSKVIISNLKQGDNSFIEDENYGVKNITLNNKQNITFKLTGENLIDDADYRIYGGGMQNESIYKGSELESGVDITYYTNLEYTPSSLWVNVDLNGIGINASLKYSNETNTYDFFNILLEDDPTLTSYDYNLSYTNFNEEKIQKSDFEYMDYYVINSNYHNKDNSLSLNINGEKYLDKDYSVLIYVKQGNNTIFTKEINVNGLLLNEGYKLELNDLILELNKEITESDIYTLYIQIDDIVNKQLYKYNSIGKDVSLGSDIFFENGKKNLSAFRGDGNYFFSGGIYDTNKDVFTKYSTIYLRYIGENFINENYDYILEYGNYDNDTPVEEIKYDIELKKGQVNGLILNTTGLLFQVDNYKNYENPTYRLTIKKGEEVLFASTPVLYIVDSPTLANASLKSNNKNLYLKTNDLSYIATRNAPIDIVISGLGFDENTDYDFAFCYMKKLSGEEFHEEQVCENIKINGKDLNKGTAKIHFDEKIDEKASSYSFYVMCDLKTAYMENVAIQGGFDVTFVDSKDLFPTLTKYIVDNVSDLIKDITKNTSVSDFVKNIAVKDNGKVKIFDNTGTNEVTGNVGTGMIARVLNENDENVLDLDVVVKGDVSGDGKISITDLVKVKRHLAEEEVLTGVYELAGNVSNTGKIGITDLVKISRDVADIQEVQ